MAEAILLKEKELNEIRSQVVSILSHEFRTPLAVVLSSSDLLTRYLDRMSDDKKMEHLDKIRSQVKRLDAMIDDVLAISRADAGHQTFEPTWLNLSSLCQRIIDELQLTTSEHRFSLTNTAQHTSVYGDEELLRHAITNLIANAIKYSPSGGSIEVTIVDDENTVQISITDHGIGIPEADQKRLFELFHRASNVSNIKGTGLGLAIVKRAVERHGGKVEVVSTPNVGSTFTIFFPVE